MKRLFNKERLSKIIALSLISLALSAFFSYSGFREKIKADLMKNGNIQRVVKVIEEEKVNYSELRAIFKKEDPIYIYFLGVFVMYGIIIWLYNKIYLFICKRMPIKNAKSLSNRSS